MGLETHETIPWMTFFEGLKQSNEVIHGLLPWISSPTVPPLHFVPIYLIFLL